jgi:hypothetical protein
MAVSREFANVAERLRYTNSYRVTAMLGDLKEISWYNEVSWSDPSTSVRIPRTSLAMTMVLTMETNGCATWTSGPRQRSPFRGSQISLEELQLPGSHVG